jgi:tRNA threonylcarbamoyladenosine biosynthesis protein TsaB
MTILAVRTDVPQTELYIYKDNTELASKTWESGRTLAGTLLSEIDELLASAQLGVNSVQGIIYYEGPGSFTGLRIGASVVNGLAYSLRAPVVAVSGAKWINEGQALLSTGNGQRIVLPRYGSEPHITL